jgi:hypothetical protein
MTTSNGKGDMSHDADIVCWNGTTDPDQAAHTPARI